MNINIVQLYISLIVFVLETSCNGPQLVSELPGFIDPLDDLHCEQCGIPPIVSYVNNGNKVDDPTKYPWIVSLTEKKNPMNIFCGGMIISRKFVLTAAHCVDIEGKRSDENCLKGSSSEECYRSPESIYVGLLYTSESDAVHHVGVKRIVPHPKYHPISYVHDIALVELKKTIGCYHVAKPICVPYKNLSTLGQTLSISGWGKYDDKKNSKQMLKEGRVQQINDSECIYPTNEARQTICAVGNETNQASCQGDSGTALFASFDIVPNGYFKDIFRNQFFALGVTSLGLPDCSPEEPDSYTDVFAYRKWIESVVKNLPESVNEAYLKEQKNKIPKKENNEKKGEESKT